MRRRPLKKVGEILLERGLINLDQLTQGLMHQKKSGASLGSSLIHLGLIDYVTLEKVLAEELDKAQSRKIGEILLESGRLTLEQLNETLRLQQESGRLLGEILVEKEMLSPQQLFDALSTQFDVKVVEPEQMLFKKDLVDLLTRTEAASFKAVPLCMAGPHLVVAFHEPFNNRIVKEVEAKVNHPVEPAYITSENFKIALDKAYPDPKRYVKPAENRPGTIQREAHKSEARKLVDLILGQALLEGASFVHLEPVQEGLSVRLRIDGALQRLTPVPPALQEEVVDTLKTMAHLKVEERHVIQNGYFTHRAVNKEAAVKLSTFPVLVGFDKQREKMTIKLLNRDASLERLEDLGFYSAVQQQYENLLLQKQGIVLISGPMDSGMTTTLYASLRILGDNNLSIATIEKNIDTFLDGVAQTQVDSARGYSFGKGLHSVLMDDADVVMVSEIEDDETAALIFQAALNGRRILSGVHASDATSIYSLLREMGVEPLTLGMGLSGVLSQKLVRRICVECREAYHPSSELLESLRLRPNTTFFRGRGCQKCAFSGYQGRIGLFELFVLDESLRNGIATGLSSDELRRLALQKGLHTLRMDGFRKALEGITTLEQVLAVSGRE